MMKIINTLLIVILGLVLFLSCSITQVYAADPSLSVQLLTASVSGGSYSYSDSINTSPGNEVTFYIELKNTTPSSTSQNTLIKLSLPDGFSSSANPTVSITNSNGGSVSDGTTVNFSSNAKLTLKSNSTELTWDRDGDGSKEFNGSKVGDSITTSGVNIGDLQGGDSFVVQVITKANVEGGSGGSTPQSSGGAVKQNSCTDSKPGKIGKLTAGKISSTSVKVEWEKVSGASSYNLVYGTSPGNYIYGVNNLGDVAKDVNYLDPNATYFFAALAINGCMPGELSDEVSTPKAVLGEVRAVGEVKAVAVAAVPTPPPASGSTPQPTPQPAPIILKTERPPQTLGWKLAKLTLPIFLSIALFSLLFYVNNQISTSFIEKIDLDSKKVNTKKSRVKNKLTSWWLA